MSSNNSNTTSQPTSPNNVNRVSTIQPNFGNTNISTPKGRSGTLRSRPSDPGPSIQPLPSPKIPTPAPNAGYRQPTPREFDQISRRLGEENIRAKKEELLLEKEKQLKKVIDSHDDAIREQFHLERFITMITGWDPKAAKVDNSPVFLEWKDQKHNLLSMLPPPSASQSTSSQAGPSRPRSSLPARTTRRQAHEQSEILTQVVTPSATPVNSHLISGKVPSKPNEQQLDITPISEKAKGKRRASDIPVVEDVTVMEEIPVKKRPGRKPKTSLVETEVVQMLPPPVPAKRGRPKRITMNVVPKEPVDGPDVKLETQDAGGGQGKKRGRMSLPNLPAAKKTRGSQTPTEEPEPIPIPITKTPREPSPLPPTPVPLPSLAHLPFPPPPKRPAERIYGPRKIQYTEPSQKPTALPKHDGQISPILGSYIHIEDSGPLLDLRTLENRAAKDGYFRARVMYLQSHGRLQRLIDEAEAENNDQLLPVGSSATNRTHSKLPARKTDFQDSLMSHMVQVRNAMLNEAKMKPIVCKRVAKMIQAYWERIEGREERERLAEEKERKRIGKELIKGLRKRWALAVKIVRAKLLEIQKIEQDRLGKEHLQNILQRSTGLLEAQVTGPEEDENEDADSEDDISDATEDVSAAEDSEEEDEMEVGQDVDEEGTNMNEGTMPPASSAPPDSMLGDEEEEEAEESEANQEQEAVEEVKVQSLADIQSLVSNDVEIEEPAPSDPSHMDQKEQPSIDDVAEIGLPDANGQIQLPSATAQLPSSPHSILPSRANGVNGNTPTQTEQFLKHPSSSPDPLDLLPTRTPSKSPIKEENIAKALNPEQIPNSETNGNHLPTQQPLPIARSRRARKIRPPVPLPTDEDPDINDVEFIATPMSDVDERDVELDVEMEDEDEDQERDSEDEGLLKDADIPIEELLKRYGYPVPEAEGGDDEEMEEEKASQVEGDNEDHEQSIAAVEDASSPYGNDFSPNTKPIPVNGYTPTEATVETIQTAVVDQEIATDKSLLDEKLPDVPVSPQLIIEGKRQRRTRSVWSPDAETPQHLSSNRKPKIEIVNEVGGVKESSPESTSEEEEETSSEEDSEEGEEAEEGKGDKEKMDVDEGPRVRQPFLLRGNLRPYQQAGLEWLASLWENGMNGILADEMGLGKTIQTISLLGHLACDKGIWGQHLIIVPTSVILNWEMEFKKFFPGMKVLTYYGNQKERKEKRIGWLTENSWQVCITSYQIVLADQHIFRRKNWCYMILDEAHNIKNFRSQRWQTLLGFKAKRRLLLTGTPLQNNLMELWSLLYFLMPGGIGADATAVVGFANHREFMEWFSNPMDKAIETGDAMDEDTLATVSKLHTLLRPFILRRLKSEVETQLPGKFEHVVYCKLSKRQRFLYDEFMSRSSTKEALTSGGYLGVMNTLMQLRKVCNHPDLFEVRPVRTSFAMDSVARDFEPQEILLRRRFLAQEDSNRLDIQSLGLGVSTHEQQSGWVCRARSFLDASDKLPHAIEPVIVRRGKPPAGPKKDTRTVEGWLKYQAWAQEQASILRWRSLRDTNRRRCSPAPIYGSTFLKMLGNTPNYLLPLTSAARRDEHFAEYRPPANSLVLSLPDRAKALDPIIDLFAVVPPNVVAKDMTKYALPGLSPTSHPSFLDNSFDTLHRSTVKLQIAFPDSSLLQYDCGKLQTLYTMLRDLKAGGHRVLIFTQMTRVLDILEIFLSYNGHRYLRLDGSTKIEDRQIITERFNSDPKYFVFIASSRSGGVGINLTGADTVFFYDSDWNPSMDRQCMDRAHRIGQTREVHIYRFVSSHTVEENMLKKANQKRLLDKMVIQQGEFNNDWWGRVGWKDMFGDVNNDQNKNQNQDNNNDNDNDNNEINNVKQGDDNINQENADGVVDIDLEGTPIAEEVQKLKPRVGQERELAKILSQVEDEEDVQAAKIAQNENELDFQEFDEVAATSSSSTVNNKKTSGIKVSFENRIENSPSASCTPITPHTPALEDTFDQANPEEEEEYEDDGIGGIDEYMLKWVEEDWSWFISYRA
ncbi:uncharacterized protein L201_004005 [Kwoniella dendrophila CBS 6074]|uniref:Helicase SWR1 n=1 Tax=Kwoniella dendrophila CBS 6074 TaxID=1295534 RepID=A0AAX4JUL7_9TREE